MRKLLLLFSIILSSNGILMADSEGVYFLGNKFMAYSVRWQPNEQISYSGHQIRIIHFDNTNTLEKPIVVMLPDFEVRSIVGTDKGAMVLSWDSVYNIEITKDTAFVYSRAAWKMQADLKGQCLDNLFEYRNLGFHGKEASDTIKINKNQSIVVSVNKNIQALEDAQIHHVRSFICILDDKNEEIKKVLLYSEDREIAID